eukprot:TRINITY_DN18447_c0_g1_i1.p2 TRINITY_DN18447_c0_g1~~TRINITY_DN18447_c0_g1_i1.p2  ORF type:complete len:111 (+),score=20.76 TRINITY_DN18447_c0_g1_i1:124-456(+)
MCIRDRKSLEPRKPAFTTLTPRTTRVKGKQRLEERAAHTRVLLSQLTKHKLSSIAESPAQTESPERFSYDRWLQSQDPPPPPPDQPALSVLCAGKAPEPPQTARLSLIHI